MSVISNVGRKSLALTLTSVITAAFALVGTTAAQATVASANIRLIADDKATLVMTEKTYWTPGKTCSATTSCDYVKMVTAGSVLALHYNVTDGSGAALANTGVTLNVSVPEGKTAGTFTGALTGTTNSSGDVTFTLTNTNTSANSEPYPIGMSNLGYWDDSRGDLIGTATEYVIVPTIGATTEVVDSVMTHVVKNPVASANIRLKASDKLSMTDKTFWDSSLGGVPCSSAISCAFVKFVVAGDELNLNYIVTNAAGQPLANMPVALNLGQPDDAIPTSYTGNRYKTTDANGEVTFTLRNTATAAEAEPRPSGESTMIYWSDTRVVEQAYALDFTPSVGATTENVDRVWSHTVKPAAVSGTANIYLTPADRAGMTDKSHWWTNEPESRSLVKFVLVGKNLVLNYVVTDANGAPIASTPVTLAATTKAGGASFTGDLTRNTDANGAVTFTLTNTNASTAAEDHPYAPSSMTYWDENRLTTLTTLQYEMDFVPTVGAEFEHVDRVWSHVVKPGVPTAPQGVNIKATGTTTAVASWQAPIDDGNGELTGYTYTLKNGTAAVAGKTGTITGTSVSFSGLVSTGTYSVVVTANNALGSSTAASSVGTIKAVATTLVKVSGAVTRPTGVAGNTSVSLTWTAPTVNNNASISGYSVVVKDGATTVKTVPVDIGSKIKVAGVDVPGTVITGLTNGRSYTFSVYAINAVGSSPVTVSAAVIPFTLPGTPTGLAVTRGNASLNVSWVAPASDGGSPITGYTITYTNTAGTAKTATALATATSASLTKLVNGTTYTVKIQAKTAKGLSLSSGNENGTPATVPVAPKTATAVKGSSSGSVVVTWTQAASTATKPADGGAALSRYEVTVKQGTTVLDTYNVVPALTTKTISGLTNGTAYTFSVVAVNEVGNSVAKVSAAATPSTTPGAPTIGTSLSATGATAATSLTAKWTAPSSTGGSAITGYEIKVYLDGVQVGAAKTATASSTSLVVTGLTTKKAYTFTVAAKNINGTGTASAQSVALATK